MMRLRHCLAFLTTTALLTGTAAHARKITMAKGSVHFNTPASWIEILTTQGDPEVRVFQVPAPSGAENASLARVSVTIKKKVADLAAFKAYRHAALARARQLRSYQPRRAHKSQSQVYTAQENHTLFHYVEFYYFTGKSAIKLRCLRPVRTREKSDWTQHFDKNCRAIAGKLGNLRKKIRHDALAPSAG